MYSHDDSHTQENDQLQTSINISHNERNVSLLGGLVLLQLAIMKRGRLGLASAIFGTGLMYRGLTGVSPLYQLLNINRAVHNSSAAINVPHEQGHTIRASITINNPLEEIYAFWRDFQNLAEFLSDMKSIQVESETRSHWIMDGPLGMTIEWDAEIITDKPDEMISWRSMKNPYVDHAGSVYFKPAPNNQGTEIQVEMKYILPAGAAGDAFAAILGHSPKQKVVESLHRLKQILEIGSVPTTEGQPSIHEVTKG